MVEETEDLGGEDAGLVTELTRAFWNLTTVTCLTRFTILTLTPFKFVFLSLFFF